MNINIKIFNEDDVKCIFENNKLKYYIDLDLISEKFEFFKGFKYFKNKKITFSSELLYFMFIIKKHTLNDVYNNLKMFDYCKATNHIIYLYLNSIDDEIVFLVYGLLDKYKYIQKILKEIIIYRLIKYKDIREYIIKYDLYFINITNLKYKIDYCDNCISNIIKIKNNYNKKIIIDNNIEFEIKDDKFIINVDVNIIYKYFNIKTLNNYIPYSFKLLIILSNYIEINPKNVIKSIDYYITKDNLIEDYLNYKSFNINELCELYNSGILNNILKNLIISKYKCLSFIDKMHIIIKYNIKFLDIDNNIDKTDIKYNDFKKIYLNYVHNIINDNYLCNNHVIFKFIFFNDIIPELYDEYFIEPFNIININKIDTYKILLKNPRFAAYHILKNDLTKYYIPEIYEIYNNDIKIILNNINDNGLYKLILYNIYKNDIIEYIRINNIHINKFNILKEYLFYYLFYIIYMIYIIYNYLFKK